MENEPKWFCPNCKAQYSNEFLEGQEVDDGICPNCYYVLLQITNNIHADVPFEDMKKRVTIYGMRYVWDSIELKKDMAERIVQRKIFFDVLKHMGLKFELFND